MDNPKYCAWITTPSTWGGGIELAILASHYRREIAAWNLETGACHVFGEDAGDCVETRQGGKNFLTKAVA
jgi:ubiquitin thioesterase OTU1